MKKGNTFTSLFPQSLPAKKSPHVCRQLKIGLSAWGNAQAQSHYQTKLSSDVEPVYFWGVEKRGISSLCNWRLEKRRVGAQRLGDYGKMSLSWTFPLISHFAVFFFQWHYTIFFKHVSRLQRDLFIQRPGFDFFLVFSFAEFTRWCAACWCFSPAILRCTIYKNTTDLQRYMCFSLRHPVFALRKLQREHRVIPPETFDSWNQFVSYRRYRENVHNWSK